MLFFKGFLLKRKSPLGDLKQESYRKHPVLPVSVKKHSSGEEHLWEEQLSEHQIIGRREVSPAGLQGKGSHRRSVFAHRHR